MRGLKKSYMKRGHQTQKETQKDTSRLLDQLGPEGRVGENCTRWRKHTHRQTDMGSLLNMFMFFFLKDLNIKYLKLLGSYSSAKWGSHMGGFCLLVQLGREGLSTTGLPCLVSEMMFNIYFFSSVSFAQLVLEVNNVPTTSNFFSCKDLGNFFCIIIRHHTTALHKWGGAHI